MDQVVCGGRSALVSRPTGATKFKEALDKLEVNELVSHNPGANEDESRLRKDLEVSKRVQTRPDFIQSKLMFPAMVLS